MSTVKEPDDGCVFCRMLAEANDEHHLILRRGTCSFVVMNLYPYNTGHLMVVPFKHTGDFSSLSEAEHLELANQMALAQHVLRECLSPHGFNIGMNLGRVSGAGITDHLHYHIVPRWNGDSNFMPVIADTKVISEGLQETWRRLKAVYDTIT